MEKKIIRVGIRQTALCFLFFAVFCAGWILWKGTEVKADTTEGLWKYREVNGGVSIVQYTGDMPVVEIPSEFAGKKVITIGSDAFSNKQNMHTVKIPSTVREIAGSSYYGSFRNCKSLMLVEGLEYVTYIGQKAFVGCTALESVKFGGGLTYIGSSAFENCPLKQECFQLPASLTEIGEAAFKGCSSVTSVTIPAGVTALGREAFQNCGALNSVEIRVSGTVGSEAFQNCAELAEVTVASSDVLIEDNVFAGDTALRKVTLQEGILALGESVFSGCTSLESVHFPKSLRITGGGTFEGCTALRDVVLEEGLLEIGGSDFKNCSALETIVIPNGVAKINSEAFRYCSSLVSITIPNSVRELATNSYWPVFSGDYPIVMYGYENSKAEEYAAERDFITFQKLDAVPSSQIVPAEDYIKMKKGQTRQIAYTMTPNNTTDAVYWSSSDSRIVFVNSIGEVTANKSGSVTITMETTSGIMAYLSVEVEEEPTRVSFSTYSKTINVGQKYTQQAVVSDRNGVRYDIVPTYSSSNDSIASVDANGTVTGRKEGRVTITARVGNLIGTYSVRVVNASTGSDSSNGGSNGSNGGNGGNGGGSSSIIKSLGKIKISGKGKVLTVKTVKGAKVRVSAKRSILGKSSKTVTANSKGTAKIKFKKKIKKVTVTVKVTKAGYQTKTQKKKFK